ncbi:hypothetical protein D3C76_905280 [compost metagenome]
MVEQDGRIAGTDTARRLDKGLLFQHQRIAAHQAGKRRNGKHRHGDDYVRHAAAHDRHHRDRQQNTGEGKQHVADAHDNAVPPAFVETGQQSQYRTDGRTDQHRENSRRQRDLRPHQYPAKDIAPQGIHAKPVHHRRAVIQPIVVEVIFGIERRDPGGQNRHHDQQQNKQSGSHRHRLTAKSTPELQPRRADMVRF